jgi:hypothetical protein
VYHDSSAALPGAAIRNSLTRRRTSSQYLSEGLRCSFHRPSLGEGCDDCLSSSLSRTARWMPKGAQIVATTDHRAALPDSAGRPHQIPVLLRLSHRERGARRCREPRGRTGSDNAPRPGMPALYQVTKVIPIRGPFTSLPGDLRYVGEIYRPSTTSPKPSRQVHRLRQCR